MGPPQTFTTPDVHHLRRSPPQTFTTPFVKSDVHHPRHSPPQTFTTPYSKMRHSPPPNIHHSLQSSPPKEKFTNRPSIQNVPAVQTTIVGQFGTKQFGTGQFGTKIIKGTIWHQDNKRGQFGTKIIKVDNLAPGQFGTRTIWHRTIWHRTIWHQDNLAPNI